MSASESDFNEVNWYAGRANAACQTASEIQGKYPNAVHVTNLETISPEKVQAVSVRGTASLKC
jgi:hypothetical protein